MDHTKFPAASRTWKHGLLSGSAAAVSSAAALALRSRRETGSPYSGLNAVSHRLWGDQAARHDERSWRYTALGYAIHHASALFWGVLFQRAVGRRLRRDRPGKVAGAAAAATAVACLVDYKLTPRRLQPGFEQRLSTGSLALVYSAFAIGLAAGAWACARRAAAGNEEPV